MHNYLLLLFLRLWGKSILRVGGKIGGAISAFFCGSMGGLERLCLAGATFSLGDLWVLLAVWGLRGDLWGVDLFFLFDVMIARYRNDWKYAQFGLWLKEMVLDKWLWVYNTLGDGLRIVDCGMKEEIHKWIERSVCILGSRYETRSVWLEIVERDTSDDKEGLSVDSDGKVHKFVRSYLEKEIKSND